MSEQDKRLTYRFLDAMQLSDQSRFDRLYVPSLILVGVGFSALQLLQGDWVLVLVSGVSIALMVVIASLRPLQTGILGRQFTRRHATFIAFFWVYSLIWVSLVRIWGTTTATGKDSQLFYLLLIAIIALTLRAVLTLVALTKRGYKIFVTRIPLWELFLVALNELIAIALMSYVVGQEVARILQTDVFTIRVDVLYTAGSALLVVMYYLIMQLMWLQRGNDWLSQNRIWVVLARILSPIALLVASLLISQNIARLSDHRAADLLGTASINQAILALSPVVWVVILFVIGLVYTGRSGLRERFLPDALLELLPDRTHAFLQTVSDMDILLFMGFLSTLIPFQIFLFNSSSIGLIDRISEWLDSLREQIVRESALIDSSEQIIALIATFPFYLLVLGLLVIYASVLANRQISSQQREKMIKQLPIGLLILLIVILYLCAIPFSQILVEGKPQSFGSVVVFDFIIPLILIYGHYFALVRLPYGRGQNMWREQEAVRLESQLSEIDTDIDRLDREITSAERVWTIIQGEENQQRRVSLLHKLIDLNGQRDRINMNRLQIVARRQALAEVSETPISGNVSRLPVRILTISIPVLFLFKIYYDGLLEIITISDLNNFEDLLRIIVEIIF